MRFVRYTQAFDALGISIGEKVKECIKLLEKEGYTERGICYGIGRGFDKIMQFKYDPKLIPILINEVRKYAYKKNDCRWNNGQGQNTKAKTNT
jgi:hypothetical protein